MVRSPSGDTVAGVLQGDTLAPYMFIICQDYILETPINLTHTHTNITGPLAWWLGCLLMARETGVQSLVASYQKLKE